MKFSRTTHSSLLLLAGCVSLLLIPSLFNGLTQRLVFSLAYVIIFISALSKIGVSRKSILLVIILVILQITGHLLGMPIFQLFVFLCNVFFFTLVVVKLITIIAQKKEVSMMIILDAVSAYLLIGITFFLFNLIITGLIPGAIQGAPEPEINIDMVLYYTMVTFTTLGYGDLSPAVPVARSVAILTALTGQIYLTIVIALIVGKYLSREYTTPD